MTLPNLLFWIAFFGVIAALLAFSTALTAVHPLAYVLAAGAVGVVHEHA